MGFQNFLLSKVNLLNMNTNILRSKRSSIIEMRPKMTNKNIKLNSPKNIFFPFFYIASLYLKNLYISFCFFFYKNRLFFIINKKKDIKKYPLFSIYCFIDLVYKLITYYIISLVNLNDISSFWKSCELNRFINTIVFSKVLTIK